MEGNNEKIFVVQLYLNSLWGKFSYRQNMERREYDKKFYEILLYDERDNIKIIDINDNMTIYL